MERGGRRADSDLGEGCLKRTGVKGTPGETAQTILIGTFLIEVKNENYFRFIPFPSTFFTFSPPSQS